MVSRSMTVKTTFLPWTAQKTIPGSLPSKCISLVLSSFGCLLFRPLLVCHVQRNPIWINISHSNTYILARFHASSRPGDLLCSQFPTSCRFPDGDLSNHLPRPGSPAKQWSLGEPQGYPRSDFILSGPDLPQLIKLLSYLT